MVVTSRGIVRFGNFEAVSRLYKRMCSGLLRLRHTTATLLLPAASFPGLSPAVPWPTPITHLQCTLSLPFPSVSLPRHFQTGFEWGFPDLESLPFSVHRVYLQLPIWSLFLIGGEEAERESQKWTPSWVLWHKGLGNSWGKQNCLWTQLNFRFLLQETAHSGTAYFKTKFCSYVQNHSSFFFSFSFTLALSLKTVSPCAKSFLECTPIKSIPSTRFIQLKWFIRKLTNSQKKVL